MKFIELGLAKIVEALDLSDFIHTEKVFGDNRDFLN